MNDERLLRYIEGCLVEGQIDYFLIRLLGSSSEIRTGDLDSLLSYFEGRLSVGAEAVSEWIKNFCSSNKFCSVGEFADSRGKYSRLVIERISRKPTIFIFGAGHVGQALALISVLLGYDVVVVDDRSEFACRSRLPDLRIRLVVDDFSSAIGNLSMGPRSAAVIVTRGHQFDEICLQGLLRLQTGYLGMIGSKRRVTSILKRLKEQGFTDSELKRVNAPIGLPIGARSPQEIAISILAEIIAESNGISNH
jgi:xanthine/CO dehydrogenase XdhC/CoxF family maturation factor